jgi:saccharopine dehydrogenase-like NADP-dependent oxidoreductase
MKIAIFGTGGMGKAIIHLLKTVYFSEPISIVAFDREEECPRGLQCDEYHSIDVNQSYSHETSPIYGKDFDLVFSALPYFYNPKVASLAVAADVPYFDLGGSVPISRKINERYKNATVFTDLGLAPGWVNIMAEEAYRELSRTGAVEEIRMRCGGLSAQQLPKHEDPFGYAKTWSADGLYNEYADDCEVLEGGKITTVPGMLGLEDVKTQGVLNWQGCHTPLEAFFTSGGASHTLQLMKDRGVKHCSYKTLRYQGHRDLVHYFIHTKGFSPKGLSELFAPHREKDIVILDVWGYSDRFEYRVSHAIHADFETDGYSAMQKATAAGFIAAALSSDVSQRRPLTYADVDIDLFNSTVNKMGIMK